MKGFDSLETIDAASLPEGQAKIVKELLSKLISTHTRKGRQFNPEEDGFVVLIEKGDNPIIQKSELGYMLKDAPLTPLAQLKPVAGEINCYITAIHYDDQFSVHLVIPDEPWLNSAVRKRLEANLEPARSTA